MIYTVGALGVDSRAEGEAPPDAEREKLVKTDPREFLAELYMTAANFIQLVTDVNATGLHAPIARVRVPLVGGGMFIHPEVGQGAVGQALLWGIHSALAIVAPRLRPQVEIMGMMAGANKLYLKGGG